MWCARLCGSAGPDDEFDPAVNGDPDGQLGEETEDGYDEMSPAVGWDDESDGDDEGDPEGETDEG